MSYNNKWTAFNDIQAVEKGLLFSYSTIKKQIDKKELNRYCKSHTLDRRYTIRVINSSQCQYKDSVYKYEFSVDKKSVTVIKI